MLKKISSILAVFVLMAQTARPEPWGGTTITVTAGTAQRLIPAPPQLLAVSISFQMAVASTGYGYVLFANPGTVCAVGGSGTTLIAQIGPGSSTSPGQQLVLPYPASPQNPKVNVRNYCVDGSVNGDHVTVTWNISN